MEGECEEPVGELLNILDALRAVTKIKSMLQEIRINKGFVGKSSDTAWINWSCR